MTQDYFEEQHHTVSLVYFSVGDLALASRNNSIEQVIYLEKYRKISKSSGLIEGILDLDDQIIILTDLRKILNVSPKEHEEPMVIIYKLNGTLIGFIVDFVSRVHQINTKEFRPALPIHIDGVQEKCFYGIITEEEDKNVLLIDLDKVFSREHVLQLSNVSKVL